MSTDAKIKNVEGIRELTRDDYKLICSRFRKWAYLIIPENTYKNETFDEDYFYKNVVMNLSRISGGSISAVFKIKEIELKSIFYDTSYGFYDDNYIYCFEVVGCFNYANLVASGYNGLENYIINYIYQRESSKFSQGEQPVYELSVSCFNRIVYANITGQNWIINEIVADYMAMLSAIFRRPDFQPITPVGMESKIKLCNDSVDYNNIPNIIYQISEE